MTDENRTATGGDRQETEIVEDRDDTERSRSPVQTTGIETGFDAGFFDQVVAGVGVGVGVYDETGRFTYVNEAYTRILGQQVDDVRGTPIWGVNPLVQEDKFERYWNSFDIGETRQTETIHQRSDGTAFPVETHTTAVETDGTCYHVGTISDISERVEGWRELERQDARLEQFASVLSHDMRNPLTVAMGRLQLVTEECESEHLASLADSLERMEALMDSVLTLAREGGRLTDPEPVSVHDTAVTAWKAIDEGTSTAAFSDDLGTVQSSDSRLGQIFECLFRNAVTHGSTGSGVTVSVGLLDDGRGFYVEDDGRGVACENREDVFEYGYSTEAHGTGFGLPIVRQIADAHGWTVTLTASHDGGARLEFHGVDIV